MTTYRTKKEQSDTIATNSQHGKNGGEVARPKGSKLEAPKGPEREWGAGVEASKGV